ncbi:Cytochrome c, mono-and diheme variants [Oryzisolibacter propanilivorax]|uniref:Cytochrome c, mono-and diheme variants n=1 Tax=Oryzisolibacter propanilivorax TaxID=1527607 RepID=A0A1G9TJY3_9BURK|nr:cytochrome c [Oryzisolibacter propanilivorax]SDM47858.1 Cytochrome c, mono-and diheme variants [Oryzisolibacter propanilivorax]
MKRSDDRRAQQREHEDPEEAIRPIPMLAVFVTLAMVVFGVAYLFTSEPLDHADLGDQRTVADLAGKPAAAAGAAVDGKALFAAQCAACHQATGKGLPGVFPPLDGSEWVKGEPRVLANILLHGINGEITVAGTSYQGAMPAFAQLSDDELAAVASYIRSGWSNQAEAVPAALFATERAGSERKTPFEGGAALKALTQ